MDDLATTLDRYLEAGDLRLDLVNQQLLLQDSVVDLRPKSWSLLKCLVSHPGQLLSKDQLMQMVWGDTVVTEASLNQTIRDLRKVLGDDARAPRYIETVHRRGFRFVANIAPENQRSGDPANLIQPSLLIGRSSEIEFLRRMLAKASDGNRQFCFVTGEPGIGKTRLVSEFVDELDQQGAAQAALVGRGQCIEQHGEGEAYMPVLEALDRIARGPEGDSVCEALERYAPTWLAQLPWLAQAAKPLGPQGQAVTPARMLREFCLLLESLTEHRLLILWLEDLHWSDAPTIDLLDAISRRIESARLLVIASYRPVDAAVLTSPVRHLKINLVQQNLAQEMPLELLKKKSIREILQSRYSAGELLDQLTPIVMDVSDGNPMFATTLCDFLEERGQIANRDGNWEMIESLEHITEHAPESLNQAIELQLRHVGERETALLEAASCLGQTFVALTLSPMVGEEHNEVEDTLDLLARRGQFLRAEQLVRWPDHREGMSYSFLHDAYRQVLNARIPPGRSKRLHLRAGEMLEAGYAGDRHSIAAELASHFEMGRDPGRAIEYLCLAAERALTRSARGSALAYLERALKQIPELPRGDAKDKLELDVLVRMLRIVIGFMGYHDQRTEQFLPRMLELCRHLQDHRSEMLLLVLQSSALLISADLDEATQVADDMQPLVQRIDDPILTSYVPFVRGVVDVLSGHFVSGDAHLQECISMLGETESSAAVALLGQDSATFASNFSVIAKLMLGLTDSAQRQAERGVTLSIASGSPMMEVSALDAALSVAHFSGDVDKARELIQRIEGLLEQNELEFTYSRYQCAKNWLKIQDGAIDEAIRGLNESIKQVVGAGRHMSTGLLFISLAEALILAGRADEAETAIERAFEIGLGRHQIANAEAWRVKGELAMSRGHLDAARQYLETAISVAREQQALALELRAANSLVRLDRNTTGQENAVRQLARVLERHSEGFHTAEYCAGKSLLNELSG